MPEKKSIFRQAALDRLSSPEQLDRIMQVTTPKGWIALLALCGIVLTALIWSVLGRIPTTVSGSGILIKSGGIYDIEVMGSGVVSEINVRVGDFVKRGHVIARLQQPQIRQEIAQANEQLRILQAKRDQRARFTATGMELETVSLEQQRQQIERRMEATKGQIKWLEQRVNAEKEALSLGIITRETLQNTIQRLESARGERANAQTQLKDIEVRKHTLSNRTEQNLDVINQQIRDAQTRRQSLELRLDQTSRVTSPYTGYVQEVKSSEGQIISQGMALVSLEKVDAPLQAVAFIPTVGQKINPGLKVRVSPATVKQEEHGFMLGRVASVSGLPATQAGMMRILNNQILVQQLTGQGAPFMAEIMLELDPRNVSGYRWSSEEGPPITVESGTVCGVQIVVKEQRPISLVIPYLKEKLGI